MSCVATEKTVAVSTGAGNLINVPVPCTQNKSACVDHNNNNNNNEAGMNFLGDLGRRITKHTDDHRES